MLKGQKTWLVRTKRPAQCIPSHPSFSEHDQMRSPTRRASRKCSAIEESRAQTHEAHQIIPAAPQGQVARVSGVSYGVYCSRNLGHQLIITQSGPSSPRARRAHPRARQATAPRLWDQRDGSIETAFPERTRHMLLSAARSPCERRTGPRRPPGPELEALPREGRRERPAGPALRARLLFQPATSCFQLLGDSGSEAHSSPRG